MKQIRFIAIIAATSMAMAGCAKVGELESPEEQEITITASFAENQTKTTLQDGGTSVYWEPSDEIKLFYGTGSGRFMSTNTSNSLKASFTGSLNVVIGESEGVSETSKIWGLYPYCSDATFDGSSVTTVLPSDQIGKAGSFAKDMNISLAQSSNYLLGFYNVCGGVRFSVTRDDVQNVVFKALNGESVAGKVKIAFEGGVPAVQEVVEGVDSIILTAPAGGAFEKGKWYYIVVLPGTLSGGFKMTFNTETKYAVLESTGSKTIKRGTFGSLADADEGLTYKYWKIPEYIDLGLSVKWATCNLGATSPEKCGDAYAWGETTVKSYYDWPDYRWGNDDEDQLTKYTLNDGYYRLSLDDDAAFVNKGESWRMPTSEEAEELIDKCSWVQYSSGNSEYNGTEGYEVIGPNGNSIFIPLGIYRYQDKQYNLFDYWTSTRYGVSRYAYTFLSNQLKTRGRHQGFCIRPVLFENYIPVSDVILNESSITVKEGLKKELSATIIPTDAYDKVVCWSSSNPSIANVDVKGKVEGISEGYSTITAYVNGKTASCRVHVISKDVIDFADSNVEKICIDNFDSNKDGFLTKQEANAVTNEQLAGVFTRNSQIESFEEFIYFTGITELKQTTISGDKYGTFESCSNLSSIRIPDSVQKIDDNSFQECTSLTRITIPKNVTRIGDYAFKSCTSLYHVVLKPLDPPYLDEDDVVFYDIANKATLVLPDDSESKYRSDAEWSYYIKNCFTYVDTWEVD